ncbi:bifunctional phosphoglucose/phosphomannose isomerase [soil metagenome]
MTGVPRVKPELAAALLDDEEQRDAVDPSGALGDVEATPRQWRSARDLPAVRADTDDADAVIVLGMGGSGISGDVLATLAADRLPVPVVVHKGYGLPAYAGPRTVVAAVSYSGGTEETLSGAEEAVARGARLLAITSGGALAELASGAGAALVRVPGGGMPRHSLGWLAVPLLTAFGLDDGFDQALAAQEAVLDSWASAVPTSHNPGKQLAARLRDGTVACCYGSQGLGALAALRLKCQLNENAKLPAFAASVPELCHNEVVGWEGESDLAGRAALLWLSDPEEHPRNARRVDALTALLGDALAWSARLEAVSGPPLARLASLVLQADLLSVYTALVREVDPTPIASIAALKDALARQGAA